MRTSFTLSLRSIVLLATLPLALAASAAELVSSRRGGSSLSGASGEPSISGDGRYVVFSSLARLDQRDQNSISDVYLKDRESGEVRRLSDARGGDRPAISANGRYVAFRALDTFPKIRFVDLESSAPPRTVSYSFDVDVSFHYADSAAISPDGTFVAFPFRPSPGFTNASDPQLCVNTTNDPDSFNASTSITRDFLLETLGRTAMTRDGNTFFLETSDGIVPADTNGNQDIYRATRGSVFVVRLSATENGLPETGRAFDPVVTADGSAVFFIANRRLRSSDTDGRATIYRSSAADGFATPEPIATDVQPLALAPLATSDGQYLAFLGKAESGPPRPYVWRASNGAVKALAPSAEKSTGVPVISADNGFVAFASGDSLAANDQNQSADVFVVPNPFAGARLAKPVVNVAGVANGTVFTEGSAVNLFGTAVSAGGLLFTIVEIDGQEVARAAGGSVQASVVLSRGVHSIRVSALDLDNVPGQSAALQVTVIPGANSLKITALRDLQRTARADGSTAFSSGVRIDNTFAASSGPLQIALAEIPDAGTWEFFGSESDVPAEPEKLLALIDLPSVPAGGFNVTQLSAAVTPPTTIGNGFQGSGSSVVARVRELIGGNWFTRDQVTLLEIRPLLNEETPGPNGGIPVLSQNTGGSSFTPTVYQAIQVQGPSPVAERTSVPYSATAIFNNGSQPCRPDWSVENGGSFATISPLGVLTVGDVSTPKTINIKATLGGRTQTLPVTITPVSPVVSVIAQASRASETGAQGTFTILRTPVKTTALTVAYKITGSATAGQDYTVLSGTATIPAGRSSVKIPVIAADDAFFEGREKVALSILPSPSYRRGGAGTATVTIDDDEPGQPDATIQASEGSVVGALQFGFDGAEQRASLRGIRNQASIFTCRFINRTPFAQNFTIGGGYDFLGFTVRYLAGGNDVTSQVADGSLVVNNVPSGDEVFLKVRITPSGETPIGSIIRCPITLNTGAGSDVVEALVKRVR